MHASAAGDAVAINQVWTSLIDNAVDAIDGGGMLRIRTACEDDAALVEITDNGRGMSEEVQRRAFEPFFSTRPMGTGLGLDTAMRIVRQHHGDLTCASIPGETTFRVRIPFRRVYGI